MKFPKKRFFWIGLCVILIIVICVLITNNVNYQNKLQDTQEESASLSTKVRALNDSLMKMHSALSSGEMGALRDSLKQLERQLQDMPTLSSWDIDKFKEKGLQNPIEDIIGDLRNHRELIPYKGTLGGTMAFWPSGSYLLTSRWALAYFEDGHNLGYMLLEYKISNAGKISWRVIDSYLD
jgi:hypothetical protein